MTSFWMSGCCRALRHPREATRGAVPHAKRIRWQATSTSSLPFSLLSLFGLTAINFCALDRVTPRSRIPAIRSDRGIAQLHSQRAEKKRPTTLTTQLLKRNTLRSKTSSRICAAGFESLTLELGPGYVLSIDRRDLPSSGQQSAESHRGRKGRSAEARGPKVGIDHRIARWARMQSS